MSALDPTRHGGATIVESYHDERSEWVVLSLQGSSASYDDVQELGERLLDLLFAGFSLVTVDLTTVGADAVLGHTLVAGGQLFRLVGGCVVVSTRQASDIDLLNSLDSAHVLALVTS